jgi:FAD/FMN-containing dehydrogenase
MAAGGYGSLSRKYGLLADNVLSAKVVDAQGRVLQADTKTHPDLFFAIRGGGGGSYGIVVEAVLRLVEVPEVTLGHIRYKGLDTAVELLDRCVAAMRASKQW